MHLQIQIVTIESDVKGCAHHLYHSLASWIYPYQFLSNSVVRWIYPAKSYLLLHYSFLNKFIAGYLSNDRNCSFNSLVIINIWIFAYRRFDAYYFIDSHHCCNLFFGVEYFCYENQIPPCTSDP